MNEEMFKAFVLPILLTCNYNITLDEADEIVKKLKNEDYKSSQKLLVNTRMNCSDRRGNE